MRVLVTGGAGFIGSHVVDVYRAAGHQVSVVDDLSSGRPENLAEGVPLHRVDIRDRASLDGVFRDERPELVNHHAAHIDVRRSMSNPTLDAEVNVLGTLTVLECCRHHGTGKIVLASTGGALYGAPDKCPVAEDYPPAPLAAYGVSKMCAEHYLRFYQDAYSLECCCLRYGNVCGPRQDPWGEAGVVAIFTRQMLAGNSPTIYGDGTQERDFVYVADVAHANLLASREGVVGAYNIGTGLTTSINEVYRLIAAAVGFDGKPVYAAPRAGEVQSISLDPSLAREELGWVPDTDLPSGIRATVEHFRSSAQA